MVPEWLAIDKTSGVGSDTVQVTVLSPNETANPRVAFIVTTAGGYTRVVKVTQQPLQVTTLFQMTAGAQYVNPGVDHSEDMYTAGAGYLSFDGGTGASGGVVLFPKGGTGGVEYTAAMIRVAVDQITAEGNILYAPVTGNRGVALVAGMNGPLRNLKVYEIIDDAATLVLTLPLSAGVNNLGVMLDAGNVVVKMNEQTKWVSNYTGGVMSFTNLNRLYFGDTATDLWTETAVKGARIQVMTVTGT
jgi:hypothetical protein